MEGTVEIVSCPDCQRKLQVPETHLGQAVQCPECGRQFTAQAVITSVQGSPPSIPPAPKTEPEKTDVARRRRRPVDDIEDEDDIAGDLDYSGPRRRGGVPNRGGLILAFGIIAWVIFPYLTPIFGPLAWIMGMMEMTKIREGRVNPDGEGMVQAGRILGMIGTFIVLVAFLVIGCLIGFMYMENHH